MYQAVVVCRQKHARQVAQLEQLLQVKEADLRSLQAVVDSTQQTADAQHTQQIDSLRMSLEMSATQHRQQLENEVGQMNRLHTLQVIHSYSVLMQFIHACTKHLCMHEWVGG